ncbi:TonB-dependent receptor [Sphingobium sp. HBC34]|uniref:TonB-dependent receptor n=1 Tax=Sphingobium cyanobacteriorum TaxID=3063954 RepID=A0ABT8ZMY6_9SPHN|nr:TonB-dependent receptor [Sphingobium sp. HBC34]MDO7835566.1 TonB-dependent receptor [Sphingobium sp. HBC34]
MATDAPSDDSSADMPAPDVNIIVFGRGEDKIGVAGAASEGSVAGSDLLIRPLLRVAELLEAVPGMIAAQHSGSGKANQYFLRGFNLDHGSDFTTSVDGVQMNLRSHGHGQGYLDLNGLIPEIVDREDYRKGPYRADGGDFALAGAASIATISAFKAPWVSAEAGSYGWRRLAAGGTIAAPGDDAMLTLAGQFKVYDGPWQQPERLRHYSGFAKYAATTGAGRFTLSLQGYHGTWNPTEQIPERAVGTPRCPTVFCSPDPSARGRTDRYILTAGLEGDDWNATAYAQYYKWRMSSNPTYANADGSSAQIEQFDRRWVLGGSLRKRWTLADWADLGIGAETRYDAIGNVGVYHTDRRRFIASLGEYRVDEGSLAGFGELTLRPLPGLRVIGGLRGDHYWYDVRAKDAQALALGQGDGASSLLSPKAAIAWSPSPAFEFYANWGRGFHSNDVRGAVNRASPVPVLVRGTGKELGVRFQRPGISLTATYFWLDVASELRFVGDSNAVEPTGASQRRGYELVAFWRPVPWLALDATYTASRSRYDNGDRIPNAFENAASAGASVILNDWSFSARVRHLGPYPLIEDNSVRDKGSTIVNTRAARTMGRFELYGEILNMFQSRDKDIAYFYEAYLPGVDAAPVEGRLSRVVEPRTVRVGVKLTY